MLQMGLAVAVRRFYSPMLLSVLRLDRPLRRYRLPSTRNFFFGSHREEMVDGSSLSRCLGRRRKRLWGPRAASYMKRSQTLLSSAPNRPCFADCIVLSSIKVDVEVDKKAPSFEMFRVVHAGVDYHAQIRSCARS